MTAMATEIAENVGGAVLQVGLLDVGLQPAQHADPGDEIAQKGEGPAALLAQQVRLSLDARAAHWRAVRAGGRPATSAA